MSTRIREKCPRKFTYFVHENSPFMSTRILPPCKSSHTFSCEDFADSYVSLLSWSDAMFFTNKMKPLKLYQIWILKQKSLDTFQIVHIFWKLKVSKSFLMLHSVINFKIMVPSQNNIWTFTLNICRVKKMVKDFQKSTKNPMKQ